MKTSLRLAVLLSFLALLPPVIARDQVQQREDEQRDADQAGDEQGDAAQEEAGHRGLDEALHPQ